MAKQILIVEDEMLVAQDLQRVLSRFGYASQIVKTGEEALLRCNGTCPDVILMDIGLRGKLDGIETADLLRRSHGSMPVMFVTASWDRKTRERVEALPNRGVLAKPLMRKSCAGRSSAYWGLTEALIPASTDYISRMTTPVDGMPWLSRR